MKLLYAFFTLYLLFLAVQPCEDLLAFRSDVKERAAFEQFAPEDCPDTAPHHECSPLCICACRQMSAMQVGFAAPAEKPVAIALRPEPNFPLQDDYFHQFPDTIWQPPKNNLIA